MKPDGCQLDGQMHFWVSMEVKPGETVCDGCSSSDCPHSGKVDIGYSTYKIIKTEEVLPKTPEWCRNCKSQTAIPFVLIRMNANLAYGLKCKCCNQTYPMYKSAYDKKHVGFVNGHGDYIPPSKDGKIPPHLEKKYEKMSEERMIEMRKNLFGMTEEEARKSHQEFKEKEEMNESGEKYRREMEEKQSQKKVLTLKERIANGEIYYDKKSGVFIDSETNQIIKI
jgi:anti-sigma28 factor (negative regulator of flagellin synthesis)